MGTGKCSRVKKNMAAFLAVVLPAAFFPSAVHAAEASVAFGSERYDRENGEQFPVGVYLTGDGAVADYYVELRYDSLRLKYVSGADSADEENGLLTFEGSAGGERVKLWITFEAVSGGEAALTVDTATATTADGASFHMASLQEVTVYISGEDTAAAVETFRREMGAGIAAGVGTVAGILNGPGHAAAGGNAPEAQGHADAGGSVPERQGNAGTGGDADAPGAGAQGAEAAAGSPGAPGEREPDTDRESGSPAGSPGISGALAAGAGLAAAAGAAAVWVLVRGEKPGTERRMRRRKEEETGGPREEKDGCDGYLEYDEEPEYDGDLEYDENPDYDSDAEYGEAPGYDTYTEYGEALEYDTDAEYGEPPGYDSDAEYGEPPEYGGDAEDGGGEVAGDPPVIRVENVTMKFRVATGSPSGLKDYMIQRLKRQITTRDLLALDGVSFDIYKGEVVGIIGTNGSGKSTLLKIVSGALKPTGGRVAVDRSKIQLLTLGTGFDMELSARENVYLSGAIIGYPKEFIDRHYDGIVAFAELGGFMDEKVKNFSSGMVSRLGFAIATAGDAAEILILDEVLSVGDEFFRKKSLKRVREMIHGGSTVILVSHSMKTIQENCSKVVWIEKGVLQMVGDAETVCKAYQAQAGVSS